MAVDGDDVDDDDDRDMLLLSLLLCWNAALRRCPCDLPLVWVHVRVVEACGCNGLWPLVVESLSSWGHERGQMLTMSSGTLTVFQTNLLEPKLQSAKWISWDY